MSDFIDLSNTKYERYFVVGKILGDFSKLVKLLHEQNFTYKDALIANGDFINIVDPQESISVASFISENKNCFAVKGRHESSWLDYTQDDQHKPLINYQLLGAFEEQYKQFLTELPLIIKLPQYYYVVHAGVQPHEGIHASDREVYASIGKYNENSRFYQFSNPEKKSWFDFKIFDSDKQATIIFSAVDTDTVHVPAGINLYRSAISDPLVSTIIHADYEPTILNTF